MDLKFCTDKIRLGTNLSPKIHRLGLTQTLGKSDRRKNEKWEKTQERNDENHKQNI
jgi:hypothetical protein